MAEIEIYSAAHCPFAYRSRLTLGEKKLPFKRYWSISVDSNSRPDSIA
jgi:glutaredoxin 2